MVKQAGVVVEAVRDGLGGTVPELVGEVIDGGGGTEELLVLEIGLSGVVLVELVRTGGGGTEELLVLEIGLSGVVLVVLSVQLVSGAGGTVELVDAVGAGGGTEELVDGLPYPPGGLAEDDSGPEGVVLVDSLGGPYPGGGGAPYPGAC